MFAPILKKDFSLKLQQQQKKKESRLQFIFEF
jgi:hypothetical protein